jgi:hypothetical protein
LLFGFIPIWLNVIAIGEVGRLCYNFSMTNDVPQDDKNRLISLAEAAEMYGFNPRFLGELARKGRLNAQKVGNSWITTARDIEAYIHSRQKTGAFRKDIQAND